MSPMLQMLAWLAETHEKAQEEIDRQTRLYGPRAAAYWEGIRETALCGLRAYARIKHGLTDGEANEFALEFLKCRRECKAAGQGQEMTQ